MSKPKYNPKTSYVVAGQSVTSLKGIRSKGMSVEAKMFMSGKAEGREKRGVEVMEKFVANGMFVMKPEPAEEDSKKSTEEDSKKSTEEDSKKSTEEDSKPKGKPGKSK